MEDLLTERLKHRHGPVQRSRVAAHHDRQGSLPALFDAAAHGGVQYRDVLLCRPRGDEVNDLRADRAEFDVDVARLGAGQDAVRAESHFPARFVGRQRSQDDVGPGRDLAGIGRDPGAVLAEFLEWLLAQIVDRQFEARPGYIDGHGLADATETNETDLHINHRSS